MKALNYNFRKIRNIALIGAMTAFVFASCGKETQQQPKIARLVFDKSGHHIEFDPIRYYLEQGYDSIYMIPEDPYMYANVENISILVRSLKDRCELSDSNRINGGESLMYVNKKTDEADRDALREMRYKVYVNT